MNAMRASGVDTRAFAWALLPLERKLGWERDAARLHLAAALAAERLAERQMSDLQALFDVHAVPEASTGDALDPTLHRHRLAYVRSLQLRLRVAGHRLVERENAVARSRAACARCERQLESLLAVHATALNGYVRTALLRQDRQADTAWLARAQAFRSAADREVR